MNARCVIADDERLMREQLRARLAEAWPELQVVAEARNGAEAVELAVEHRVDVVFLDIRMPGMTGVDAAKKLLQTQPRLDDSAGTDGSLADWPPEIVFITAYDQYAVQAFEQGAVDYVLKPPDRARLEITVERLKRQLHARRSDLGGPNVEDVELLNARPPLQQVLHALSNAGAPRKYLRWIQASVGSTIQMIPVEEVLFFISDEKYTRVQTENVEALIRKPIKELVEELDPELFWQIHRSTLVNVTKVQTVDRDFRGRQLVSVFGHPERLEVSRSYVGLFKGM